MGDRVWGALTHQIQERPLNLTTFACLFVCFPTMHVYLYRGKSVTKQKIFNNKRHLMTKYYSPLSSLKNSSGQLQTPSSIQQYRYFNEKFVLSTPKPSEDPEVDAQMTLNQNTNNLGLGSSNTLAIFNRYEITNIIYN